MAFDIVSFIMGQQSAKGGGSVEGVHFVTFMSEDGSTELYKRPVADGDDCADPVDRGLISEPTKESTAQYNYTHVGWSASPNGALDSNILKAITADKTVYANFAAVVRYYTVTYYDEDGTTVLKTESLAYGATPSYVPDPKGDYVFNYWEPQNTTVAGDTSYIAVWKLKPAFGTASWDDIISVAQSGYAADNFSVGDERTETITYSDGTTEQITWVIAGLANKITTKDGSKSNMIVTAKHALSNKKAMVSSTEGYLYGTTNSYLKGTFFNALPESLQNAIKPINVGLSFMESYASVWVPTLENIGSSLSGYTADDGNTVFFEYFNSAQRRIMTLGANGEATIYWTRNGYSSGSTRYFAVITATGSPSTNYRGTDSYGIVPCFCI